MCATDNRIVLIHDTRSKDSRSNNARFKRKLYAHKETGGGLHHITLKSQKDFTE